MSWGDDVRDVSSDTELGSASTQVHTVRSERVSNGEALHGLSSPDGTGAPMSRRAALPELSAVSDLQLLRLAEASVIAKLSVRTLRRALHADENRLRCYRFGRAVRISPDDLTAWMRAHAALPLVSTTVLDTLSAEAKELIQRLDQSPARSAARRGDGTAKVSPKAPANNLPPEPPTRLDCAGDSSVHVATDPRSKEEAIPMHDASQMARFRAKPARTARTRR